MFIVPKNHTIDLSYVKGIPQLDSDRNNCCIWLELISYPYADCACQHMISRFKLHKMHQDKWLGTNSLLIYLLSILTQLVV